MRGGSSNGLGSGSTFDESAFTSGNIGRSRSGTRFGGSARFWSRIRRR